MKKSNVSFVALLALLTLTGCTIRGGKKKNPATTDNPSGDVSTKPDTGKSSDTGKEENQGSLPEDPYAGVLKGLDKSKAKNTGTHHDYATNTDIANEGDPIYDEHIPDQGDGYLADDGTAYGWCEYEVAKYHAKYGVAVHVTFDNDRKLSDIVLGAPGENYVNFTPMYAESTGREVYIQKYVGSLRANVLSVIKGMDAIELLNAFAGLMCDDSGADGVDTWTIRADDKYDFMGTGATQTDTRIQKAIYHASLAYVYAHYSDYDPFFNGGEVLFTEDVSENLPTVPNTGTLTLEGHGFKGEDGFYYGYDGYSNWGTYYGNAFQFGIDKDGKVTSVKFGYPMNVFKTDDDGSKSQNIHNFTPNWIQMEPKNFYDYSVNSKAKVEKELLGKKVNAALVNKFKDGASYVLGQGEDQTQSSKHTIVGTADADGKTGSTQTNARMNLGIAAGLQAYLDSQKTTK